SRILCRQETDWEDGQNRTPCLTSCNAATLPLQCVGQLIRFMPGSVIHVIPSTEPLRWVGRATSPTNFRHGRKAAPGKAFHAFSKKEARRSRVSRDPPILPRR